MSCDKKCDDKYEKIKNLKSKNICVTDLKNKNAEIETLDVNKILVNGVDITCSTNQIAVETVVQTFLDIGSTGVTGPADVDPVVFDALVENAEKNRKELQCRIYDGRCFINDYLKNQGCPESCPPPEAGSGPTGCFIDFTGSISDTELKVVSIQSGDLENGQVILGPGVLPETYIVSQTSGETGSVGTYQVSKTQNITQSQLQATQPSIATCELKPIPLKTFGAMTIPIYTRFFCGVTGATGVTGDEDYFDSINSGAEFNLQCTYLLEVAKSIDPRVVSVLIQVGYYDDETSSVIIEEVFIANKQFYPTLDTLYGENFANVIAIPSDLLNNAYTNSQDPNKQGAIQMVVYEEEGLCIWTPEGDGFECRAGIGRKKNPSARAPNQVGPKCNKGDKLCSGIAIVSRSNLSNIKCLAPGDERVFEKIVRFPAYCVPCNEPCVTGKPIDETRCTGACFD